MDQLQEMAKKANGNVDTLIIALMRHARKHGHQSIYLTTLLRNEDELIEAGILGPIGR